MRTRKHIIYLISLCLIGYISIGNVARTIGNVNTNKRVKSVSHSKLNTDTTIYKITSLDKAAEFPGGEKVLMEYIQHKLNEASSSGKCDYNITGTLWISFIVEKDGSLSTFKIVKEINGCTTCNDRTLNLFKNMPKWNAGQIKGISVRSRYTCPVRFRFEK